MYPEITKEEKRDDLAVNTDQNYRNLFNSIRDAILIADPHRVILDCNPAFTRIFGYERDEIVGKPPECIYETKEEFIKLGRKLVEHAGQTHFFHSVRYKRKNGEVFPGEINVYYLSDENGKPDRLVGLIRDVSKRIRVEDDLKELLEEEQRLARKSATEVALASRIQRAMMEPPSIMIPEIDVSTQWIPASEMSGDFYNLEQLDIDRLGFWLGDVSAKGVPAGLLMVLLNAHLQSDLYGKFVPGNIVSDLNSRVYDFLIESENFSTLFLGMLNSKTGLLTYSDAGHGHAFIYRDKTGKIERLQATVPPLGIQKELIAVQQEIGVNPGDMLVVFSDGIIEARSPNGERFGMDRLLRVVRQNGSLCPYELRDAILTSVAKFSQNSSLSDDLTLLIVRRRKTPGDRQPEDSFKASGDPLREWAQGLTSHTGVLVPLHEWVARICSEIGPDAEADPFMNACQLGVSELVTNVIKHAYRGEHGRIEVQAFEYPNRLEFVITDQGLPYETGMLDTEHLPTLREGRYGLMITQRVMDEVVYTRSPQHENVWRLTKRFQKDE